MSGTPGNSGPSSVVVVTTKEKPAASVLQISVVACALLVLLRVAIGWQFFYEGLWKFRADRTPTPWSAEGYLKNSQGPFRNYFRNLVDDPYGLEKLNFEKVVAHIGEWRKLFVEHYGLTEEQKKKLDERIKKTTDELGEMLKGVAWAGRVQDKYEGTIDYKVLGEIELYERLIKRYEDKLVAVRQDFQQEHLDSIKSKLDAKHKELVGPVDEALDKLHEDARQLLTIEQIDKGPSPLPARKIDRINTQTKWLLTVAGLLLMAGLFSRTAAIVAAFFLLNVYLSLPPWPGVPEAPGPEHSLIVNKNLIELIACLALAALPSGRWLGMDALIHRFVLRGKTD